MIVIAIDPGPTESACVLWDGSRIVDHANPGNRELVTLLENPDGCFDHCAIEQIRGFGVMASDALFDTCMWTGRFLQAFGEHRTTWIPRKVAAAHVCGTGGISKDQFVREALIARFGGKETAIGTAVRNLRALGGCACYRGHLVGHDPQGSGGPVAPNAFARSNPAGSDSGRSLRAPLYPEGIG
jgi:hypothetical protein